MEDDGAAGARTRHRSTAEARPVRAARRGRLGMGFGQGVRLARHHHPDARLPPRPGLLPDGRPDGRPGRPRLVADQPLPADQRDAAVPRAGRGGDPVGDIAGRAEPARSRGPMARVLQVGTQILYIGGSDGTTAQSTVYVAQTVGTGNFDKWAEGPTLPEPRADASVAYVGRQHLRDRRPRRRRARRRRPSSCSAPTARPASSGSGPPPRTLALPEARAETAVGDHAATACCIVGGRNADGPVATTLKTKLNSQGKLGAWTQEQPLVTPQAGATGVADRRLRVAVRRQRRERPDRQGPARLVRHRRRRGTAGQSGPGQGRSAGTSTTPRTCRRLATNAIRLGRERGPLPRRRQ